MFKTTDELNKVTCIILNDINNNVNIEDIKSKFSDTDFDDAFEYCYQKHFIDGVIMQGRNAKGSLHFQVNNPRLSPDGLYFIEHFNQ